MKQGFFAENSGKFLSLGHDYRDGEIRSVSGICFEDGDCILCFRTFHFLQKPVETLKEMLGALKPGGRCLVTFETDNFLRRLLLFGEVWTSEQYYYKTSDVEEMFLTAGFDVIKGGVVMRVPVTLFRRCPRSLLWILRRLERLWPWAMHEYVIGMKREKIGLPF